jgi:hypothetical protein
MAIRASNEQRRAQRCPVQTDSEFLVYNPAVPELSRRLRLFFTVLALGASAWAQNRSAPPSPGNTPKATDPTLVSCGDHPPFTSRTARGDTLVAPDGKHRAYAEVEATALHAQRPAGYTGPLCVNNSRLLVAVDNDDFKIRFLQEPADVENGNSLRLLDWSADSRRLLAELAEWQYEQPGVTRSILLYDTRFGTFQQPDLNRALAHAYGRECSLNFHVLGFDAPGKVVLEAHPLSPEEEEVLGVSSCSRKKTYFTLDRTSETLVSVPEPPQLQHNAKAELPK